MHATRPPLDEDLVQLTQRHRRELHVHCYRMLASDAEDAVQETFLPLCFDGRDALAPLLERAFGPEREGDWRLLPTWANRMPAAASYLRRPGDTEFRAFKLDVLRVEDGAIAEITTFGYALFDAFGLPMTLPLENA